MNLNDLSEIKNELLNCAWVVPGIQSQDAKLIEDAIYTWLQNYVKIISVSVEQRTSPLSLADHEKEAVYYSFKMLADQIKQSGHFFETIDDAGIPSHPDATKSLSRTTIVYALGKKK